MALPKIADYPLPKPDDLPESRAPFRLCTDRAALLIHDMQRYFCAAYGEDALTRDGSLLQAVTSNIASIAKRARASGMPVFYTAQKGNQHPADRGLQKDLWGPGMKAIPDHEEIINPLRPEKGDIQLVKHRYSAFQRSNLQDLMRARGRDQLLVTGIYAHIGCLATTTEAFQRDIEPFFVADAVADFSAEKHKMALDWVSGCSGAVIATSGVLAAFDEGQA
ncbi:MAG: isochorismatase family protein [Sedimentitalea sp.]|uniref:isochorismatase family protein n=1 Tax=Sedimentitalea sp. TaxID=2048915 RepID=UPI003266BF46